MHYRFVIIHLFGLTVVFSWIDYTIIIHVWIKPIFTIFFFLTWNLDICFHWYWSYDCTKGQVFKKFSSHWSAQASFPSKTARVSWCLPFTHFFRKKNRGKKKCHERTQKVQQPLSIGSVQIWRRSLLAAAPVHLLLKVTGVSLATIQHVSVLRVCHQHGCSSHLRGAVYHVTGS